MKELLQNWGLPNFEIEKILKHHVIKNTKDVTITKCVKEIYNYFLEKNFLHSQIIRLLCKSPEIFCFTKHSIQEKEENLRNNGYTKEEVNKLIKNNPKILNYSIEYLNQKIEKIIEIGFTKEEVLRMALKAATLLELDVENNIKTKITNIENLGFSYKEVIKIAIKYPEIFSHNILSIIDKIENIKTLGFNEQEVRFLINNFPTLLGLSFSNIKEKIEYLKEIKAVDAILINPSNLMQSASITYARNEYFKDNNISFDTKTTYINYLFCGNTVFEHKFGISKNTLLNKYNFKEYSEEKNYEEDIKVTN